MSFLGIADGLVLSGTMMVSHMPFQVLLYYNRIYFVIWALLFATSTLWKV